MKTNRVSTIWVFLSVVIALLVASSSLLGIFNPVAYSKEAPNWALQAIGQDEGNLLAVMVFLITIYLFKKKSLKAYFIWLGVLIYFIYAYLIYAFFVHFNYLFLVYVAALGLSSYTLIGSLLEQNLQVLAKSSINKNMNSASILLILIGALFTFLWLSEIIPSLIKGHVPASADLAGLWVNPVHVIDLALVLPGMILTGVLLWRRKLLGYIFWAPWLTFSILMGSSIVFTMLMELKNGNSNAIIPLIMIGLIVISSFVALSRYIKIIN
jgi:hypothetical protein